MRHLVSAIDLVNKAVTLAVGALLMIVAGAVMWQVTVRFVLTAAG